jgi:hypothetical protein
LLISVERQHADMRVVCARLWLIGHEQHQGVSIGCCERCNRPCGDRAAAGQ